jgi:hypothetical protein
MCGRLGNMNALVLQNTRHLSQNVLPIKKIIKSIQTRHFKIDTLLSHEEILSEPAVRGCACMPTVLLRCISYELLLQSNT